VKTLTNCFTTKLAESIFLYDFITKLETSDEDQRKRYAMFDQIKLEFVSIIFSLSEHEKI